MATSMNIEDRDAQAVAPYAALHELEQVAGRLADLSDVPEAPLRDLRGKLASQTFNLVVVGQFKRGKTSVINALIGADLLPVGVIPLTSVVTVLSYGNSIAIRVLFDDERQEAIAPERLVDYVTEKGNPHNVKGVREVAIAYPSPWLQGGVRLIDTPGIGSVYRHNTDVAYRFLPRADAVLFMLSVDQPVSQAEHDFLKEVSGYAGKTFVLLNKIDLLSEAELRESLAFTEQAVTEVLGQAEVYPVSARRAIEANAQRSDVLGQQSRFPAFSQALRAFLLEEKGRTLVTSIGRTLLRLISQTRFNLDLELKSLATPIEELRVKVRAFEDKRREVLAARDDYAILMDGEIKKLQHETVEEDLNAFLSRLVKLLLASVDRRYAEHRRLPLKRLHETLEQEIIEEMRGAYDEWRVAEDAKVAQQFNAACERLAQRLDQTVDELFRFSAELFAVPYDAVRAESLWTVESGFYYMFWSEPVSLEILSTSALFALPKAIGDRLVLRRIRRFAQEYADIQSGRLRYDFAQRLERSGREFKTAIMDRIEATVAGVESAVTKGTRLGQTAAQETQVRTQALTRALQILQETQAQLMTILENLPAAEEAN